ncbi:hypothetical protein FJY63_04190 [Candidatus Sumerlaeota bacterium]|nr:hypothetical protein [Candidatus Sumerlaeota bacterium]
MSPIRPIAVQWDKRDWLALTIYLALAHAIFFPALRPNVFLWGTDTVAHDYGLLRYNWSQIAEHGQLPLWNPYLFCGLPSLGTFASCPFYPLQWLFVFVPFALAFTYQYIASDWLAGLWTYWAARWMGLGRTAAFFAGMAFMVSGHVVTLAHAGHLQKVAAISWMPFVFGCATAAVRQRRWAWWVACGVGLAAQLLASHLQIAYYTMLFLAPWILWLALFAREQRSLREELLFAAAGVAIALAVAGGLSAAQVIPAIETTPLTNRGAGLAFDEAASASYPPLEFLEYLLPSFLGDSTGWSFPYRGQWGERIVTDYMGILPIILALYALVAARDRNRWFWLALIVIAAVLATGRYTPVYRVAFNYLPGLNRFRSPGTIMVFIAWPVALLAGYGLEKFRVRIQDRACGQRYLVVLRVWFYAGIFAVIFAAILALKSGGTFLSPLFAAVFPSYWQSGSIWQSLARSLVVAAISCAALVAVVASARWSQSASKGICVLASAIVFILAFLDPRLHEWRYIKANVPQADVRRLEMYLFHDWTDAVLRGLTQPIRGVEIGSELSNRMMTRGIGTLHGYHPVYLNSYADLLRLYADNHPQLGRLVFEQFLVAPESHDPGGEYQKALAEEGRVVWLRRPAPLCAYFPEEMVVAESREAVLAAMANADFNPYRVSYTLDPELAFRANAAAGHDSTATATLVAYSPNRIDLRVSCDTSRPLVLAELAAPGWQWTLDSGERFKPLAANHAFRAAMMPAGSHSVSLLYRPFSLRVGLYMTLLSVLFLVLLLIASVRVARRRSAV